MKAVIDEAMTTLAFSKVDVAKTARCEGVHTIGGPEIFSENNAVHHEGLRGR